MFEDTADKIVGDPDIEDTIGAIAQDVDVPAHDETDDERRGAARQVRRLRYVLSKCLAALGHHAASVGPDAFVALSRHAPALGQATPAEPSRRGIHALTAVLRRKSWIPGLRPGMTAEVGEAPRRLTASRAATTHPWHALSPGGASTTSALRPEALLAQENIKPLAPMMMAAPISVAIDGIVVEHGHTRRSPPR